MTAKFTDGFLDHAIELIESGSTLKEAASFLGCDRSSLGKAIGARRPNFDASVNKGARCPNRNDAIDSCAIVALYRSGESVKAIASRFSVARDVVARILDENDVARRGRSSANFVRMSKMTAAERSANAAAAHAKIRSLPRDVFISAAAKRAAAAAIDPSKINTGPGEVEIFDAVLAAGFADAKRQVAVDQYSIDIAFGSVAVEVKYGATARCKYFRSRGRFEKIAELGLKQVIVAILDPAALSSTDEIVALLQVIDRKPPSTSKYWVVRSGLQKSPLTRFNGHKHPAVEAPPELVTSIREVDLC